MSRTARGPAKYLALIGASALLAPGRAAADAPAGAASGELVRERAARVHRALEAQVSRGRTPGLQYVVVSPAGVLFEGAAGWADLGSRRRLEPSTTMMAYSMTKTVTAVAVLQLVERGAVSLDTPVRSLLPDIPYDDRLLVRHLLSQTSGVPNPMPLRWVHLPGEHARFDEQARLAAILAEHRELEFPPGARYGYSNLSYWLLGRLVEQVTGARFSDHLAGAIFRPLDLSPEEMAFTIPAGQRHAQGYLPRLSLMNLFKRFLVDEAFIGERQGPWVHVNDAYVDGPAYGGLVTSARALARLLQDLLADDSRLLGPRGRRLLLERQRDPDGEPVEMTLGWHVGERDGAPYYFKEGGGAGFHGEMRLYPAAGIASVVIANNAAFDVKDLLGDLDGEFLRPGAP